MTNKKYLPLIAFIILCLIWSSTWVVIKIGLFSLPPFLAAGIRFLLAFIFLSGYALVQKTKFPRGIKVHLFFVWFGQIIFTGGYAFVYWAEQYISSGMASVLFAVMPFYVLILSIWLLPEERVSLQKTAGVILGFTGTVIIFHDQIVLSEMDKDVLLGMIAVVIAPVFSATGTIMGKKARKTMNPIVLITLPMFYASLSFFLLYLLFETGIPAVFDTPAVFSIIYLAFAGTAIAFVLYFWMLKNTSAVVMSMITFVTPPLALIWGWFLLDEQVTWLLIAGLVLILAGIFMARK